MQNYECCSISNDNLNKTYQISIHGMTRAVKQFTQSYIETEGNKKLTNFWVLLESQTGVTVSTHRGHAHWTHVT